MKHQKPKNSQAPLKSSSLRSKAKQVRKQTQILPPAQSFRKKLTKRSVSPRCLPQESTYKEHLFATFQGLKFRRTLPAISPCHAHLSLPKPPGYEHKKTVVFDLDETLIHSLPSTSLPSHTEVSIELPNGKKLQIGVNLRPFAKQCLEALHKEFEVIVFSASPQYYVDAVLDYLDAKRKLIHHRVYNENCLLYNGRFIKDLRILGRKLEEVIIVDDSVHAFGYQLDNGVPIIPYRDDQRDRELVKLCDYLLSLRKVQDVRKCNREAFKLHSFYEDYLEESLHCTQTSVSQ